MKVEGYELAVYCDGTEHVDDRYKFPRFARFMGTRAGDCRRNARRVGWKITKDKDLCPACNEVWKKARIESRRKKNELERSKKS